MSVKTIISCNGKGCKRTLTPSNSSDSSVMRKLNVNGWAHVSKHPTPGYLDFCKVCWPKTKKTYEGGKRKISYTIINKQGLDTYQAKNNPVKLTGLNDGVRLRKNVMVTFGISDHRHELGGEVFDGKCVAVIECGLDADDWEVAQSYFGKEYSKACDEDMFDEGSMRHYPRGKIMVKPL